MVYNNFAISEKQHLMNQLIKTSDGSHTIYVPELDEHYHSIHGAVQESRYIFIEAGYRFCESDPVKIFEVGFGTGLNALLTCIECINSGKHVLYTSIEKYPLTGEMTGKLNYNSFTGPGGKSIFEKIHEAAWNKEVIINRNFTIKKLEGDFTTDHIDGIYNLIYFDAFGPDKQPDIWKAEMFKKISDITESGGIFVTYSAKGEVKRNLRSCGFKVTLLPGPPGKRQITRAIKI